MKFKRILLSLALSTLLLGCAKRGYNWANDSVDAADEATPCTGVDMEKEGELSDEEKEEMKECEEHMDRTQENLEEQEQAEAAAAAN